MVNPKVTVDTSNEDTKADESNPSSPNPNAAPSSDLDTVTFFAKPDNIVKNTTETKVTNNSDETTPVNNVIITQKNMLQAQKLALFLGALGTLTTSTQGKKLLNNFGIHTTDEYKGPLGGIKKFFDNLNANWKKFKENLSKAREFLKKRSNNINSNSNHNSSNSIFIMKII